jgi:hypothetical protein
VLRKEKSWEGWRDKKIDPEEYANIPQSGYILNKNVQRSRDWGSSGRTLFRVFHPDGFEFEISGDNLINLLMHCDISKREIMQECVLAWGGTELILMPTNSELYQESVTYTDLQSEKLTKDDFVIGCEYIKRKDGLRYMYIGRFDHIVGKYSHDYIDDNAYGNRGRTYVTKHTQTKAASPKHFFMSMSIDKPSHYNIAPSTFSLFAQRVTDTPSPKVAEYVDMLMTTAETSPVVKFESTTSSTPNLKMSGYYRFELALHVAKLINSQTMTREHVSIELSRDPNAHTISDEDRVMLEKLRESPLPMWDTTDYDSLLMRVTNERDTQSRTMEQYAIDDKNTMSRVGVWSSTSCMITLMQLLRAIPNKTVITRGQHPYQQVVDYVTWGDVKAAIKQLSNNVFEKVTMVTEDGRTVQHGPMTI